MEIYSFMVRSVKYSYSSIHTNIVYSNFCEEFAPHHLLYVKSYSLYDQSVALVLQKDFPVSVHMIFIFMKPGIFGRNKSLASTDVCSKLHVSKLLLTQKKDRLLELAVSSIGEDTTILLCTVSWSFLANSLCVIIPGKTRPILLYLGWYLRINCKNNE